MKIAQIEVDISWKKHFEGHTVTQLCGGNFYKDNI